MIQIPNPTRARFKTCLEIKPFLIFEVSICSLSPTQNLPNLSIMTATKSAQQDYLSLEF